MDEGDIIISKQGSDLAQHDGCVLIKGGQRQGYNDKQNSIYVEKAVSFQSFLIRLGLSLTKQGLFPRFHYIDSSHHLILNDLFISIGAQ